MITAMTMAGSGLGEGLFGAFSPMNPLAFAPSGLCDIRLDEATGGGGDGRSYTVKRRLMPARRPVSPVSRQVAVRPSNTVLTQYVFKHQNVLKELLREARTRPKIAVTSEEKALIESHDELFLWREVKRAVHEETGFFMKEAGLVTTDSLRRYFLLHSLKSREWKVIIPATLFVAGLSKTAGYPFLGGVGFMGLVVSGLLLGSLHSQFRDQPLAYYSPQDRMVLVSTRSVTREMFPQIAGHELSHHVQAFSPEMAPHYDDQDYSFLMEGMAEFVGMRAARRVADKLEAVLYERYAHLRTLELLEGAWKFLSDHKSFKPGMRPDPYDFGYAALAIAERREGPDIVRFLLRGETSFLGTSSDPD